MRIRAAMIVICTLAAATSAFAATPQQIQECNADESDRSMAACTAIAENPQESKKLRGTALVGRGVSWRNRGELDKALADLDQAVQLFPENPLAYDNRAFVWREKGDLDRAIADFDESIRLNRWAMTRDILGITYSHRGLAWQAKGDLDRALADFNESIRLDKDDAEFYHRRARLYVVTSKLELAGSDLDATIRLKPDHADALFIRGSLRYENYIGASEWIRQDDLDGALADFSEVIRLIPGAARPYYLRAIARKINGDKDGTIADLIESYRIDPQDKDVIALLAHLQPDYKAIAEPLTKLMDWTSPPRK